MAVRLINEAVRRLDWSQVRHLPNPADGSDGAPFDLYNATRYDYKRYVQSERQELRSRLLSCHDNSIRIVELPGTLHERVVGGINRAITNATGTDENDLVSTVVERDILETTRTLGSRRCCPNSVS
ncbi:hypothetical protein GN958_ATG11003 [Phytophthora infestans]|uniref:Uncharacterized protein n=1 Tax=Phytophthora infestans TaxID=4787 RepID=A0A8S9UJX7_PHYIN|nr:hypothetical protein GN958_ATG11003 [Phytophthora infestans]